jgi:hypothetical protein
MGFGSGSGEIGTRPLPLYVSGPERVMARALVREFGQALEREHERARALASQPARSLTRGLVSAIERVRVLERVLERARALEREVELRCVLARALEFAPANGRNLTQRSLQTSADLRYKAILYSLVCDLWRHVIQCSRSPRTKGEYSWMLNFIAPITRLPPELLQQIFLIIIDEAAQTSMSLIAVCRDWYIIVTGLWVSLNLGTTTSRDAVTRKLARNPWLLDVFIHTEVDRGGLRPSEAYGAIFAAIEVASRWRTVVIETLPRREDLPEDVVTSGLRKCSNSTMEHVRIFKIKRACEISPLLHHILRILGSTASAELTTVEINSANVISFLLGPAYLSIFHSITVLCIETLGMRQPVDLLLHLKQLQTFIASHLRLSTFPLNVDIPFTRTLRHLRLKAVSIQWMGGRTFHALESCTLIFPLRHRSVHSLGTFLPNCKGLSFEGQSYESLEGFFAEKLTSLSVRGQEWNRQHGSQQLTCISHQFSSASTLRSLHIGATASSRSWIIALESMSNLEELILTNLRPSSLHPALFAAFIAQPPHQKDWDVIPVIGEWHVTLCPSLKILGLRYDRWLRPTEQFTLTPTFMAIIWSRKWSRCSLQSFRIWLTDGQTEPLELIGESQTRLRELGLLHSVIYVQQDHSFDLVARKAVQRILKLPACKPLVHFRTRALRYDDHMDNNQASTQGMCSPSSVTKKSSVHSSLRSEHSHLGDEEESSSSFDSSDYGSSDYDSSDDDQDYRSD